MTKALRAIAAAAALSAVVGAADVPRDRFGVGVLRRDGVIIPFAAFDGRKWGTHWPKPAFELTVPVTVSAIPSRWWGPTPPLDAWQLVTPAGQIALHVEQPDWVDVHCVRQIGLRTDYRPAQLPPPPTTQPFPKDGLVIAPPHAVVPIVVVSPSSQEARELVPVVQAAFNEAERKTEDRHGHPIARRGREGAMPTVEAIYAYGRTPRVYYVEATRAYRELGQYQGDCAAVAFGAGWFYRDEETGVRQVLTTVDVLNCDRESASYMLPLGVLQLNDRVYWLAQFSGFDHERYVVLELKQKTVDVVINTFGGAC